MATVDIGSNSYTTFADVDKADEYLEADYNATAWREAEVDAKARALVTAHRVVNKLLWAGDLAESDQLDAWPRINTGITGVIDDEVPQGIIDGEIELASYILSGNDAANTTQAQNVKRQQAGSVSIEYFAQLTTPARLPLSVQELFRGYLAGASVSYGGVVASGTDRCSDFDYGYRPAWRY